LIKCEKLIFFLARDEAADCPGAGDDPPPPPPRPWSARRDGYSRDCKPTTPQGLFKVLYYVFNIISSIRHCRPKSVTKNIVYLIAAISNNEMNISR
jgi:hypothetical protein